MTAEYEITKDDLSAFNYFHHFHSATARRQYLRSWVLPAFVWLLVCVGIWYLANKERHTPLRTFLDLLPLFSGVPIYFLCFPWWYRRKVKKIIAGMVNEGQNLTLLRRHRVSISPDAIIESGDFGQNSTAWRAVERVVRDDDYAYVYINALAAIIIPTRAFATATEFEDFVKAANSYHEKSAA
jgi:hypothetical protein